MLEFAIVIGLIFILAIIFLLVRIQKLVKVVKGRKAGLEEEEVPEGNKTNARMMMVFMVVAFIAAAWYSIVNFDVYNLPVASEHGQEVETLFWVTMAVTGIVFIITNVLLFYFSWKYQYKKESKALFYPDNTRLEILWTIVPALVLTVLVLWGLKTWNDMMGKTPQDAEVVEIMGYQFAWSARYPGNDNRLGNFDVQNVDFTNIMGIDFTDRASFDDFIPREIHIPVNHPVLFKIRARDVLHSVFAPHFRMKMDAVPGMPTQFWFVPTKTTEQMREELDNPEFNYEIACTEICGRGHFSMRMLVVVESMEDYKKWKSEQQSWLSKNPEYLAKVPERLKPLAMLKTGLEETQLVVD